MTRQETKINKLAELLNNLLARVDNNCAYEKTCDDPSCINFHVLATKKYLKRHGLLTKENLQYDDG